MEEKDEYQLFVQGIPITLDNNGLFNTFVKAGPIEQARIIPPKDPQHTTTFGFVRYKSKVDASKAVEMFNNYKISNGFLKVRHSFNRPNPNAAFTSHHPTTMSNMYRDQLSKEGEIKSATLMDPPGKKNGDLDEDWELLPTKTPVKKTTSTTSQEASNGPAVVVAPRSSLMKCPVKSQPQQTTLNQETADRKEPTSSKDYESDVFEEPEKTESRRSSGIVVASEELELGGKYAVNLLEVIDADKFYVQVKKSSSVQVANMWNNLNNFYQEEISLAESDINQPFRKLPPFSIQCKLFGVSPVGLVYDKKVTDALKRMITKCSEESSVDLPTSMHILDKQVDPVTKHTVFEVDLMFANESVAEWLVKESLVKRTRSQDDNFSLRAATSNSLLQNGSIKPSASASTVDNEESKSAALSAKQLQLNPNQTYEMRLFYYDDAEKHFYLGVSENTPDLEVLDELLQQEAPYPEKFTYVTRLGQLSLYDTLEARFDEDLKWYRVCVRSLDKDSVTIYYLDFGNSQRITAQILESSRPLRTRKSFDSDAEAGLMKLPYQAIRCVYVDETSGKELNIDQFIQDLTSVMENSGNESEFLITARKYISNDYDPDRFKLTSFAYGVQLFKPSQLAAASTATATTAVESQNNKPAVVVNDRVVVQETVNKVMNKSINNYSSESDREVAMIVANTTTRASSRSNVGHSGGHINAASIARLQPQDKLTYGQTYDIIMTFQAGAEAIYGVLDQSNFAWIIDTLTSLMDPLVDAESKQLSVNLSHVKTEKKYQDGELVFMKSFDSCWYRGLILNAVQFNSNNCPAELDTSCANNDADRLYKNDQHYYSIYLVDVGSIENDHTSDEIRSFTHVAKKTSGPEWERIFTMPFLVYAFQIPNKKDSIDNKELLNKINLEHEQFTVTVNSGEEWFKFATSLPGYHLLKYTINLNLMNGTSVDAQLESLETTQSKVASLPPLPPSVVVKSPPVKSTDRFFPSESSNPPVVVATAAAAPAANTTTTSHVVVTSRQDKPNSIDLNEKPLQLNELYSVTISCFDEEMFVHLISEETLLNKIERQLGDYKPASNQSQKFKKGDLVLAKYFEDETDQYIFNWYRGVVTSRDEARDRYQVFYLDYGNLGENLTPRDLNMLPDEYSLATLPPFAHRIEFNNCQHVNLADFQTLLIDFIGSGSFVIKLVDQIKFKLKQNEDIFMYKHLVEVYDEKRQACLNLLINPSYKMSRNETASRISESGHQPVVAKSVPQMKQSESSVVDVKPAPVAAPTRTSPVSMAPVKKQSTVNLNINKLEIGQSYPAAIAFMETELFVYLDQQIELLTSLETKLSEFKSTHSGVCGGFVPQEGQLVLAKYYSDSSYRLGDQFNWCRAVIVRKQPSTSTLSVPKYEIFFFDYGNKLHDIESTQLVQLPEQFDLDQFPPLAFKISLHECNLDLATSVDEPGLDKLLTEFLTLNPEFNIRVMSVSESNSLNNQALSLIQYNVEMWDKVNSICLNSMIKELQEADVAPIETCSLASTINSAANLPFNVTTAYTFIEKLQKPFYFSIESDVKLRTELDQRLNAFFAANYPKINTYSIKQGDYVAVKSENSWYRGQVKNMNEKSNIMTVLYIDYGFEEILDASKDMIKLSELPPEFYETHRLAFACFVVNQTGNLLEFAAEDEEAVNQVISEFIDSNTSKESNEWRVVIKNKLPAKAESKNYELYDDEIYYGVELYLPGTNESTRSLNDLLADRIYKTGHQQPQPAASTPRVVVRKPAKPAKIRIDASQIPRQPRTIDFTRDIYHVYLAGGIDSFYVFMDREVYRIQSQVQLVCEEMCSELKSKFDPESIQAELELDDIKIGDYVFAKLVEDDAWYRCRVNNRNQNKYELFFMDMGNLTVIDREEIMYPWSEKHTSVFTSYPPQAYYCRMYALEPKHQQSGSGEFSMEENDKFKKIFKQKIAFHVHFLKFNPDQKHQIESGGSGQYQVVLDEVTSDHDANNNKSIVASVHMYLLENELAAMPPFNQVLKSVQTVDEIEFYKHLLEQVKKRF